MECLGCGRGLASEKFKKEGYVFLGCDYCGLLFVGHDQNGPSRIVYNQEYFKRRALVNKDSEIDRVENFKKLSAQRILDQIERMLPAKAPAPLRLLDIGCAEGYFLEVARDNNYQIFGTELSQYAAGLARKRLGKSVFTGSLSEVHFADGYFDVVCLLDVVEHFPDPHKEIEEVNRILKKGGLLYIQTPNLNSYYSKILGSRWFQLRPPEHLFYFSKKSISVLLNRSNFNIKIIKPAGIYTTARYVEQILLQANFFLAGYVGILFRMLNSYDRILYLPSGHICCIAEKK